MASAQYVATSDIIECTYASERCAGSLNKRSTSSNRCTCISAIAAISSCRPVGSIQTAENKASVNEEAEENGRSALRTRSQSCCSTHCGTVTDDMAKSLVHSMDLERPCKPSEAAPVMICQGSSALFTASDPCRGSNTENRLALSTSLPVKRRRYANPEYWKEVTRDARKEDLTNLFAGVQFRRIIKPHAKHRLKCGKHNTLLI